MTVFARYILNNTINYGIVDGDQITRISGSPLNQFEKTGYTDQVSKVKLLALTAPGKIIAIGKNYITHLHGREAPSVPEAFYKTTTSLIGQDDAIVIPPYAQNVDEEAELVVIIGKECKNVSKEKSMEYVFGYTCGNDVSARDWQRDDLQWWRAKSSDTFSPAGPYMVTDLDPKNLELKCRINGKEVQYTNTSELHFDIPTIISFTSQFITLEPGDMIYTGTPGIPAQIKSGDTVEIEISGIGILSNPVI